MGNKPLGKPSGVILGRMDSSSCRNDEEELSAEQTSDRSYHILMSRVFTGSALTDSRKSLKCE